MDPYVTELPDSFEDSVARMGKATLQCMEEVGNQKYLQALCHVSMIAMPLRFRWRHVARIPGEPLLLHAAG